MKKQHFLRGAAILGAAGIISKLFGAVYRIPFARMVGPEGIGLYQMAYPVYTLALALSTSGIPTALAIMISEKAARLEHAAARKIFRVAFVVLAFLGGVITLAIYQTAPYVATQIFHNPAAYLAIRAVAPAIFLSALVSCWRGYYQGYQNMYPTAVSQVVEQIVRVVTVLVLAWYLLPYGVAYAAAGAAFGAVAGGVVAAGVLALYGCFLPVKNSFKIKMPTSASILKDLFSIGIPVSLAGLIMPLVQGIDAVIIPGRLISAGFSATESAGLYGQLTGMALTIVNLPVMLSIALAMGVVPAISEASTLKDKIMVQNIVQQALTAMLIFALPSAIGIAVLAEPICDLLYALPQAGVILKATAPIIVAMGFYQVTSGILQGKGRLLSTLVNLTIGCSLKTVLTFYLVSIPAVGIVGAAYATAIGFFTAGILNSFVLVKECGTKILAIPFVRIGIANSILLCECVVCWQFLHAFGNFIGVGGVIAIAIITYFAINIIFGIISKDDLKKLVQRFWRN